MTPGAEEKIGAVAEILRAAFASKPAPEDPEKFPYVLILAMNGIEDAHCALCDYALGRLHAGETILPILQVYLAGTARDGFKANKKPNLARDLAICVTVRELIDCGYDKTRNPLTQGESACSLVAKALLRLGIHISETGVNQIVKRKGRGVLAQPPLFARA